MGRRRVGLFFAAGVFLLFAATKAEAQYQVYGNYFGQPGAQANRIYQYYGNLGARVFGYNHSIGARAFGWNGPQPYSNYYRSYRFRRYRRW